MNLSEFKAWFEGFTEALDGPPGPKAWTRICEQVDKITPAPTPWPTIIREYVPRYPAWGSYWYWNGPVTGGWSAGLGASSLNVGGLGAAQNMNVLNDGHTIEAQATMLSCSADAFRHMGKLDAEDIATNA